MRHPIHPDAAPPPPNLAQGVVPEAEVPVASAFALDDSEGAPLTSRREMFCRVYVACGNAAEAARRAGYAEGSARQQGWRLLEDDVVRARIEQLWHLADRVRETDRDLILNAAGWLLEESMAAKNFNAAARALVLQARLAGFLGPARDREPVVPGRPGPVARAAWRKAEGRRAETRPEDAGGERIEAKCEADAVPAEAVSGARQEESAAGADDAGSRAEAGSPSAGRQPSRACGDPRGPDRKASYPTPPTALPWRQTAADALPEIADDPWAAASRIARQRELAGVHSKLAAVRRRQDLASRARLAERDAEERAA